MSDFSDRLVMAVQNAGDDFQEFITSFEKMVRDEGYEPVEINADKPWGSYLRLASEQADRFVNEFFPGLSPEEARLGIDSAELSPKFLVVKPGQRLSWQYHDRRAERWRFLTTGAYRKSQTDDEGERIEAAADEVVQFSKGERHRLEGMPDGYVLVAEIWQHANADQPSDEDDIVRVSDDYQR